MSESIIDRRITLDDIIMQTVEAIVDKLAVARNDADYAEKGPMTMTVDELADTLGIAKIKAYELTNTPGFPSFKVGRRTLVSRMGLQDWIKKQCDEQIKGQDYFI